MRKIKSESEASLLIKNIKFTVDTFNRNMVNISYDQWSEFNGRNYKIPWVLLNELNDSKNSLKPITNLFRKLKMLMIVIGILNLSYFYKTIFSIFNIEK